MEFNNQKIYFSTITIDKWTPVFHDFPETIFFCLDAFNYLVKKNLAVIYAFVIMKDHVHVIWKIKKNYSAKEIISKFKQSVGTQIVHFLKEIEPEYLSYFKTERQDRIHKIWKLVIGNIRIQHLDICQQKIDYTHKNPCTGKYKSVENPAEYHFSSAKAYSQGYTNFKFLTLAEGIS